MTPRKSARFRLTLPLSVTYLDGVTVNISGTTVNSSASGTLFKAAAILRVGARIEYVITLPNAGSEVALLQCKGTVVRVTPVAEGVYEIATTVDRWHFERAGHKARANRQTPITSRTFLAVV
jgi:hypothetical protein